MSKRKPSGRTMTLHLSQCSGTNSWGASTLEFQHHNGKCMNKAVIRIERPSDISYIRERLTEIEAYWIQQLKEIEGT